VAMLVDRHCKSISPGIWFLGSLQEFEAHRPITSCTNLPLDICAAVPANSDERNGQKMIVTSTLTIDIIRYLRRRSAKNPVQWVCIGEVADNVCAAGDIVFAQAIDLARSRGWIVAEGKASTRRVRLTKAGYGLIGTAQCAAPPRSSYGSVRHQG